MIRYFYKIFSTLVLILSLLNLQITPTYAQADDQGQEQETPQEKPGSEEEPEEESEEEEPEEGNASADQEDSDNLMVTRMTSVSTDSVDVHLGDMLVFVVLIGIGLFLFTIWEYQFMAYDMQIAMAAGVLQIGSVLATMFATRADIDSSTYKLEKREDGTVNNMQVDALKEQRESYVALRDHAALKWKIDAAGAASYAYAAVAAYQSKAKLDLLFGKCTAALETSVCPAKGVATVMKGNMESPGDSSQKLQFRKKNIAGLKGTIKECQGSGNVDKAAAIAAAEVGCNPLIQHLTTEEPLEKVEATDDAQAVNSFDIFKKFFNVSLDKNYVDAVAIDNLVPRNSNQSDFISRGGFNFLGASLVHHTGLDLPTGEIKQHPEVLSFQENLLSLVLPEAHAVDPEVIKGLGLTLGTWLAVEMGLSEFLDLYTTNPGHRSVVYVGASIISSAGAFLAYTSMGQAEDNIKKIDGILERFGELQDMGKKLERQNIQDVAMSGLLDPLEETPQVPLSDGGPVACNRPPKNGKCPSIERGIRKFKGFDMNSNLGRTGPLVASAADGILGSSSLDQGTIDDIENLADQNAITKRALRQIQEHENKKRKKNGKGPVDFEKQANSLLSKMAQITKKSLDKQGTSPSAVLASMGYPESMSKADENVKKELSKSLKESGSSAAQAQPLFGSDTSEEEDAFNFDFGEEEEVEGEIFQGDLDDDHSEMYAKAFDAQASKGSEQIVGNRDVSIFRVISVRYMKSGLPKLLKTSGGEEGRLDELE